MSMAKTIQKRSIETRATLLGAAEELISMNGYEALRVEEVVLRAGTAKGTFFAHFKDKDRLLDLIIGPKIDMYLDALQNYPPPQTVEEVTEALMPLCEFMTCERYVFDVILRYSGAAGAEDIGPIATTFGRQIEVLSGWFNDTPFRKDIAPELLAEGIQAFMLQAMAAKFCALHSSQSVQGRLQIYLEAWLSPRIDRT